MPLTPELIDLGEKYLPWPESGLHFRAPDGPAPGLRLSEDCPSRRIIEYFEGAEQKVTSGTSLTGHLYADLFIQALLPDTTQVEPSIEWVKGYGTTSLDAVVDGGGPLDAHYEFKTATKKSPKPSAVNRRQVIRQRAAADMSGVKLPPTSVIYIIGKAGHLACFVYGPFEIVPSEQEYDNAREEISLTRLVVEDIVKDGIEPRHHPLLREMCSCAWCFPVEVVVTHDAKLTELVDSVYAEGIDSYRVSKHWYDEIREDVRQLVPEGESRETPSGWIIKHSEKGRLRIERAQDYR